MDYFLKSKKRLGGSIPFLVVAITLLTWKAYAQSAGDLAQAVKTGDLSAVKTILKKDVDLNQKISTGEFKDRTVLMLAVQGGHLDIVKVLIDHGADVNAQVTEGDAKGLSSLT